MTLVDANVVLRYIFNDHFELSKKASEIIENENISIKIEILAEIVYL
jgi:hypothetical protein